MVWNTRHLFHLHTDYTKTMKLSSVLAGLVVVAVMVSDLPSSRARSARMLFCSGPTDQLVAEGSNVTLTCNCSYSRFYPHRHYQYLFQHRFIQWFYQVFPEQPVAISNDEDVTPQFVEKFTVTSSTDNGKDLHISTVSTIESGQFFCRIQSDVEGIDLGYASPAARLSVSKATPNLTSLRLRDPPQCEVTSHLKEQHHVGDLVVLTCTPPVGSEGMVRALTWSHPGDVLFRGKLYITPSQHHSYTVTRVLQKEDNCRRFRCDAEPSDVFENPDDARCSVVPLKMAVFLSPELAYVAVGGKAIFNCSTEGETKSSRFFWKNLSKYSKERLKINGTAGRFQLDASRKILTVSPVLAEDDGTKISCQVWYEMDCRKQSSWSVLKVLAFEQASESPTVESQQACGLGMKDFAWVAACCFLAGVVVTSLVSLAVWRKIRKRGNTPRNMGDTPRNKASHDTKLGVRYTPACTVAVDQSDVYQNIDV
ncbi:uncharacterized protein LOC110974539 [Acanthaster planci]|uniref:Uncharacterized protein LOC110974539 n=1 Tax=Acanthaster planci TaxID=133434 RepID=A0A8B7XPI1_ACAPL|nr:uncharacterized protein LOC110974539 [Acanthaster planci]